MCTFYCIGLNQWRHTVESLVQACLRGPHVVADEAKLAIVFIYFFSSFFLFLLRLLLFTHFGESPVSENFFPQYFGINILTVIVVSSKE